MYQEIFGVEDDLFDFARCGAIAYEPEIYDDEQLRKRIIYFLQEEATGIMVF